MRCWLIHSWSKWRSVAETTGGAVVQERRCGRCGKVERNVTPQWDAWARKYVP